VQHYIESRSKRGLWRAILATLLVVLATGALAACGSSNSSSSSSTSSSGSSTGSSDASLAQAKQKYEEAAKPPAKFSGPTEKVPAKKGITVGILTCDSKLSGCTNAGKNMAPIIQNDLGGSAKIYDGQSNPKVWNESILQMVADKVDGIALLSIPPQLVGQGLQAAEKAGIPIVRCCGAGGTPNPKLNFPGKIFANVDVDYGAAGAASADYVTSQSGGKADVLVLTDNSQDGVKTHVAGFKAELTKICPSCKQDTQQTQTADVTTSTPQRVVAYLQAHPSVDWIYLAYDPQGIFIVPALQKAGLANKVKIAGILGNPVNLKFIKQGAIQQSDVMIDENYYAWAMTDQLLRALNKMPVSEPENEGAPWYIVTKQLGNYPQGATATTGFTAPSNYEAAYKKLWGLG
jgi:ribose transport system substrate-binding protein